MLDCVLRVPNAYHCSDDGAAYPSTYLSILHMEHGLACARGSDLLIFQLLNIHLKSGEVIAISPLSTIDKMLVCRLP